MDNITYVQMYLNILNKYGKQSKEMKLYSDTYIYFRDNKKVIYEIYKIIMKKQLTNSFPYDIIQTQQKKRGIQYENIFN